MTRFRLVEFRIDELVKEFEAISGLIHACHHLLTVLPPDDPDAIATLGDLRRLRVKREDVKAELMRLKSASVSCATH